MQRRKSASWVAGNPGKNALFGVVAETCALQGMGGGVRSQIRTGLSGNSLLSGKLTGNSAIWGLLEAKSGRKALCRSGSR
jgi:hypothetical protein